MGGDKSLMAEPHTFRCGVCGTEVTMLMTLAAVEKIMRLHAELGCPVTEEVEVTETTSGPEAGE